MFCCRFILILLMGAHVITLKIQTHSSADWTWRSALQNPTLRVFARNYVERLSIWMNEGECFAVFRGTSCLSFARGATRESTLSHHHKVIYIVSCLTGFEFPLGRESLGLISKLQVSAASIFDTCLAEVITLFSYYYGERKDRTVTRSPPVFVGLPS